MTTEAALFDALKYRVVVDETGTRWYLNHNNKLHCEDGPAVEWADGSKFWYQNGIRHREDGPAVDATNGYKEWHLHGKLHRTDGPAVIHEDGAKEWWLNGVRYSEQEFHVQLKSLGHTPCPLM